MRIATLITAGLILGAGVGTGVGYELTSHASAYSTVHQCPTSTSGATAFGCK